MKIIAPTFLGKHEYPNYSRMQSEIESVFLNNDDVVIDLDFLWPKEIEPYFNNILIEIYDKNFRVRTKEKSKIKKVRDILRRKVVNFSPIEVDEEFYILEIYKE